MRTLWVHFTGLGDDPDQSNLGNIYCGARRHIELLTTTMMSALMVFAWNDPKAGEKIATMREGADFTIIGGHSHGAAEALAYTADVRYLIDVCPPFNPFANLESAHDAPSGNGAVVWQRNFPPNGIAYVPSATFQAKEFKYTAEGKLIGHCDMMGLKSIAGDDGVWAFLGAEILKVWNAANLAGA